MEQPPATSPGLLANLVSRVILAFVGILVSWVPLRLLVRNGEFAAVVFIVDVAIMNSITIVNSVIWHDDNWSAWWDGAGLCDIEVYLSAPLQTIYATSIFATMYHLTQQVRVTRAPRVTIHNTRRNIIQAAIIFPIPLIQLVFTWFDLAQRYIIGTLIGCSAVYDASWPKILVYDAPPAAFALLAVPYAVLLWRRYYAITKQAEGVLNSGSRVSIRANRTRRRLYNMSLSILVVYVPVMMYFFVCNIRDTLTSYRPYDYHRMHWSATPYSWATILFVPSWIIPSDIMNQPWIPIATTVVVVSFFGTTMEAQQIYCQYGEHLGLNTCLRRLQRRGNSRPTRSTGRTLLANRAREPNDYHPRHDFIIPSIEEPDTVQTREVRFCALLSTRAAINTPPVIPPRGSSLRPNFSLRTPTIQSIRKSIRMPSLWSRAATGVSTSGTSNKTTGTLTQLGRRDSVPMLPLYNIQQGGEDLQHALYPFLRSGVREVVPPARCESETRQLESGFLARVPKTHQRSLSYGRHGLDVVLNPTRVREMERPSFPRQRTFTSFYTASDSRTDKSISSAGRDIRHGTGIAR